MRSRREPPIVQTVDLAKKGYNDGCSTLIWSPCTGG